MESKKFCVFVEPAADRRLYDHIEFLARINENAAVKVYESYKEALTFLESSPEICPPYFTKMPIDVQLRYRLFGKRYRIVFEIVGNSVYIYDIQDCRQDSDKNLI